MKILMQIKKKIHTPVSVLQYTNGTKRTCLHSEGKT